MLYSDIEHYYCKCNVTSNFSVFLFFSFFPFLEMPVCSGVFCKYCYWGHGVKMTNTIHWHTSLSSDRGQVVNIADRRDPGPIEPIDHSAPLRHGEYQCSTATARPPCSRASRPLSVGPVSAKLLICFGPGRVLAAGSNTCQERVTKAFEERKSCGWRGGRGSIHFWCARSNSSAPICH